MMASWEQGISSFLRIHPRFSVKAGWKPAKKSASEDWLPKSFLDTKSMPKDGRKKYHPNFKKKQHILSKTHFFQCLFLVPEKKKKKKTSANKKNRFRSRKTSSFATTGWWPRSLEVMDFFRRIPEVKRERREGHLPRFWSAHLVCFFLFFFRSSVFFWLVPQKKKKKNILKLEKGPQKKTKQIFFCMLSFFGRFFREIFLFVMFVLCFCGGEKERAAVYQPDTTRKLLGFMGKSTFVCSLAIWKEKWWVPNDYFLEI